MDGWQFKRVASSRGDPAELQPWDDGGSLTLRWSDDRPEGLCLLHFSVFLSMGSRCRCPTSAPSGVFSKFSGLVFLTILIHMCTHVFPAHLDTLISGTLWLVAGMRSFSACVSQLFWMLEEKLPCFCIQMQFCIQSKFWLWKVESFRAGHSLRPLFLTVWDDLEQGSTHIIPREERGSSKFFKGADMQWLFLSVGHLLQWVELRDKFKT